MRHVVVECRSILGEAVESLLRRESDLAVTSIIPADLKELSEQARLHCPDVLVLAEGAEPFEEDTIVALLKHHPKLRVVVLSERGDFAQVYQKRRVSISRVEDLVAAIRQS